MNKTLRALFGATAMLTLAGVAMAEPRSLSPP